MAKNKLDLRPYWIRLGIILLFSVIAVAIFNEVVYSLQKDEYDRAPQTIQLVIPAGTAQEIEAGQNPPGIPAEMSFVVGDTLEVKNEDSASHQLGPLWVPPGTSASLVMGQADKLSYSCSFQTTRYLGIDVHQATTMTTRITALALAAPTTAVMLFLYSLVALPIKPKGEAAA